MKEITRYIYIYIYMVTGPRGTPVFLTHERTHTFSWEVFVLVNSFRTHQRAYVIKAVWLLTPEALLELRSPGLVLWGGSSDFERRWPSEKVREKKKKNKQWFHQKPCFYMAKPCFFIENIWFPCVFIGLQWKNIVLHVKNNIFSKILVFLFLPNFLWRSAPLSISGRAGFWRFLGKN